MLQYHIVALEGSTRIDVYILVKDGRTTFNGKAIPIASEYDALRVAREHNLITPNAVLGGCSVQRLY